MRNGRVREHLCPSKAKLLLLRALKAFIVLWVFSNTPANANSTGLEAENELLLELRLDDNSMGLDILGYQRGDDFLLSLEELASGLGFPIAVDIDTGIASGWFISEDQIFLLDMQSGQVSSGDKQWPISDAEAVIHEDGLYIDTKALEKWFPLRLTPVIRKLYLNIEPLELLPVQQRMQRKKRFVSPNSDNQEPVYPLQPTPYQFLGPHATKLRLGYSTTRNTLDTDAEYTGNYASLSRGDLGWMTSTLSLAGQSGDSLTAARLKLERTAFNGPLGVNHIEIGDVGNGGFRGVVLQGSNSDEPLSKRINEGAVTLEGSQLPDWDIELYQNNQLIAAQTTGPDGLYVFPDVALQFGDNKFELKFFGPNGEFDTREEFHFLGPGMLQRGKANYEISAVQKARTVFGINDSTDNDDAGSALFTSSVNVGLSRQLTISAGITSQESNGKRLQSMNGGLGFSTSRLFGNVNFADNALGQDALQTSLRTALGSSNISLNYTRFFDEPELLDANLDWQADIDISSIMYNVPIKLETRVSEGQMRKLTEAALGTTFAFAGGGKFSTSVWYNSSENLTTDELPKVAFSGGLSSFHSTVRPWSIRLTAGYGFQPDTELQTLSATGNLFIDNDLSLNLGIRRISSTDTTQYKSGINWLIAGVAVGAYVSFDSNERWSGIITASSTLLHRPDTLLPKLSSRASVSTGSVEARVFEDVSGTEQIPYEGSAKISAIQSFRRSSTNNSGVATIHGLPAHSQTDIELDYSTIEDYELRPRTTGVSVIPRPGSYAIVEFPLVRTSELEGYINASEDNEKNPIARALVTLTTPDGEVVAQTRSGLDGFYLFEGIEPGNYRTSLETDLEQRVMKRPTQISVKDSSGVITGLNYRLRPTKTKPVAPSLLAQRAPSQQTENSDESNTVATSQTLALPTLAAALPQPVEQDAAKEQRTNQPSNSELTPPEAPSTNSGNWYVQIAAYGSLETAQASWARIKKGSMVLQDKTARYTSVQSMTRLLVGPGSSKESASRLCEQLKAEKLDCMTRRVD